MSVCHALLQALDGVFNLYHVRQHTCDAVSPTIRRVWVIAKTKEILRERPKITVSELRDWLKERHQVDVDMTIVSLALRDVKNDPIHEAISFGHLASFLEALGRTDERTRTSLLREGSFFKRAFLALGMCVRAFPHTTRVIGLDACHIKARYGGALLVMTVLDGNGNVFPAAIGIAESENFETWFWFLALVQTAFQTGLGDGLVVLSDREKGLDAALEALLPAAAHSYCVYHIEKNVKSSFHTSLDGLLFRAAKAGDEKTFNEVLDKIKSVNERAGRYIEAIEKTKWARAFFPGRRFGHVTSNISESMNWWLDEARHLNPVVLFCLHPPAQPAL